jgi:multidrug resistance efflux pump
VNEQRPIPIPFRVRWLRFRHQLLPVLTVVLCATLAGWLWRRQAVPGHAVGAVEVVHVPVTSGFQGTLAPLSGKQIRPLDRVAEGDVVAVMDAGPIQSRRKATVAELDRLRAELKAASGAAGGANATTNESLQAIIASKEQDLADLDVRLEGLQLRAPISGTVTQVHLHPGQAVQPGATIMEISSDTGAAVMAYLRAEQQQLQPAKGMPVEVRLNRRPVQIFRGQVETVGGQVESVPSRQLRDPRVPEWGLPVRVSVPPGIDLKPGEVVTLDFKPAVSANHGQ